LELELEHPRLRAAQLEEVVDQLGEPVRFAPQGGVVARDGLGVVDDSVFERLDDGADAGERCAQIVRDPGNELAP
jgi:hypothetical protein